MTVGRDGVAAMPTYFLDRGTSMLLPRGLVRVTADSPTGVVRLEAWQMDRSEGPADIAHSGLLLIRAVQTPTVVAAYPGDDASSFGPGTFVSAEIQVDRGVGVDRVQFVELDVSGMHRVELARLVPAGDRIRVTMPPPDGDLGPFALAARDATHRVLGANRTLRVTATGIDVDIDATASMARWIDDGSVAAAVDILVGVSSAVGCSMRTMRLLGAAEIVIDVSEPTRIAERVDAALRSVGMGVGLPTHRRPSRGGDTGWYAITDSSSWLGRVGEHRPHLIVVAPTHRAAADAEGTTVVDRGALAVERNISATALDRIVGSLVAELTTSTEESRT
ncbi:hypothetical protein [Rhodococcus koreensis]